MAKKPKIPKKYFDKRPRNFEDFLNQLANTVSDMHDYITKLDKYIVERFGDIKDSEMTIERRLENVSSENEVENLRKDINSMREKLNDAIIKIEQLESRQRNTT